MLKNMKASLSCSTTVHYQTEAVHFVTLTEENTKRASQNMTCIKNMSTTSSNRGASDRAVTQITFYHTNIAKGEKVEDF